MLGSLLYPLYILQTAIAKPQQSRTTAVAVSIHIPPYARLCRSALDADTAIRALASRDVANANESAEASRKCAVANLKIQMSMGVVFTRFCLFKDKAFKLTNVWLARTALDVLSSSPLAVILANWRLHIGKVGAFEGGLCYCRTCRLDMRRRLHHVQLGDARSSFCACLIT